MYTKATVTPIGDEHKDGKPHLTDAGWVIFRSGWWYVSNADGERMDYDQGAYYMSFIPTVVITLS